MQNTPAAQTKLIELTKAANLYKSGRHAEAEAAALTLLGRYPREPLLHNILGGVASAKDNWQLAEKHFAKAVKIDPDNHEILRNLAKAQLSISKLLPAEKNLARALKLKPDFAEAWNTLGLVYLEKNETAKARSAFSKALKINPKFGEAAANLLLELEASNDLEEMEIWQQNFDRLLPGHPVTLICRGLIANRNKDFVTARELLNSAYAGEGSVLENELLENARIGHLAKINDRLGNYDEAYEQFALSNRRALASPHTRNADPDRFMERIRERFDYFSGFRGDSWPKIQTVDAEPVFMVGFSRSGTTLLDTFLRGHKDIAVTEELPMLKKILDNLGTSAPGQLPRLENLSSAKARKAGESYLRDLSKHAGQSAVRVDRMPFNILRIGEILRIFPKAKFILALRDPADVVFSCFMQNFAMNDANATFMTPESSAQTYDRTFSLWNLYLEKFDFPYFTLRYEDVVEDAETTLRPLVDFLGLEWDPAMLDHQTTAQNRGRIKTASYAQVVQPIYKTALRRWEHYADMMPEALETLKPWREYFGYS